MGVEFNLLKDMGTINSTALELVAVNRLIKSHIGNAAFLAEYDSMVSDINACYQVVIDNLEPFVELQTQADFEAKFEALYRHYIDSYLTEISRPRVHAEFVYEKNLQFRKLKEVKTGFPILKRSFARLHEIVDKWLDNDIWLAMTIDSLFKLLARLLNEINETAAKDTEDAFLVYQGGVLVLADYLAILKQQVEQLPK